MPAIDLTPQGGINGGLTVQSAFMQDEKLDRPPLGLAIETATTIGSVALGLGDHVLSHHTLATGRGHAADLVVAMEALCRAHGYAPHQITMIFVSQGPGSFTGLRIGMIAARMLAFASGAQIVPVSTLEAIALNALDVSPRPNTIVPILDAKRSHVYGSIFIYSNMVIQEMTPPVEIDPAELLAGQPPEAAVLGAGIAQHRATVAASGLRMLPEETWAPRAATVYALGQRRLTTGESVAARNLVPLYIRRPEAEEKWEAGQLSRNLPP